VMQLFIQGNAGIRLSEAQRFADQSHDLANEMHLKYFLESDDKLARGLQFEEEEKGQRILLGEGRSGKVFQGTVGNKKVAIRACALTANDEKQEQQCAYTLVMDELQTLRLIRNPKEKMVEFLGVVGRRDEVLFIFEGCDTTLQQLIIQRVLPETEVRSIAMQLCEIFKFHASKTIIHQDIKPKNILINFAADGSPMVKMAEFGFSKSVQEVIEAIAGSDGFIAPEAVNGLHSLGADIFSFGTVLLALSARREQQSYFVVELGKACQQADQEKRPSWDAIERMLRRVL